MKVNIGPYKNWIGPYQIADKIPFLSEDAREKFGDWLSETWVQKFLQWVDSKRQRKFYVRIDKYDTWNMDTTLSPIILPMLKQLRDTKHGSPMVDEEDVPPHMRHTNITPDNPWGADNWVHYKWDWVLNEMIWAFEQLADPDRKWEEQFYHGIPTFNHIDEEDEEYGKCYRLEQTNPDYWVDMEGLKRYNERIHNGTRLFGKYYQNLWD
jgi:hypothetical protein